MKEMGELGWGGNGESWRKEPLLLQAGLSKTPGSASRKQSPGWKHRVPPPQSSSPQRGDQPHTLKARRMPPSPSRLRRLASLRTGRNATGQREGWQGRDAWRRASFLPSLALSKTVLATIFSSSIDKLGRDARQRTMGSFQRGTWRFVFTDYGSAAPTPCP